MAVGGDALQVCWRAGRPFRIAILAAVVKVSYLPPWGDFSSSVSHPTMKVLASAKFGRPANKVRLTGRT